MKGLFGLCCTIAASLLLVSCGDGGPSRSEAEAAIKRQIAGFLPGVTESQMSFAVTDLKCTETGNDTYSCQVAAAVNGRASPAIGSYQFVKLNGTWNATPVR
jgi:hypothetical protein